MTARRTDPATSHEAAAMAKPFIPCHQGLIADALYTSSTDLGAEQIAALVDLEPYQIRKRLAELHKDGMIEPVSTRKTRHGRTERTWRLT